MTVKAKLSSFFSPEVSRVSMLCVVSQTLSTVQLWMVFTNDYTIFFCLYHTLESKDEAFTLFMTTKCVCFFRNDRKLYIYLQILTGEASKHSNIISSDESYIYESSDTCSFFTDQTRRPVSDVNPSLCWRATRVCHVRVKMACGSGLWQSACFIETRVCS